ncbi:MAG: hypothetical protein J6V72_14215 [Kiritimatiellae bacterium]|nr:hypothetical protein [Kiritimatiellia bacterium]
MSESSEKARELADKGKEKAHAMYEKGNELMDKVSFLKNPRNKKIAWGVLGAVCLLVVVVLFSCLFGGHSIESVTKDILIENVGKQFGKHVVVKSVSDLKLTEVKKNKWKGSADVVLKDKKEGTVSEKLKYDLRVRREGDVVEVEYASRDLIEFMKALNDLSEEELAALALLAALADEED